MAFFKRERESGKNQGVRTGFPRFGYYPPDSNHVVGMPVQESSETCRVSNISRLDASGLVGASALDSAVYKGKHLDADVFAELSNSMAVIEEKFHAGMYDAQAMPLVEAFLGELRKLADIQVERRSIDNERISDMKEANRAAYEAVLRAREQRELSIEMARLASLECTTPDYEDVIARAEQKRQRKAAKKAIRLEHKDRRWRARLEKKSEATEERFAARSLKTEARKKRYLERQEHKRERQAKKYQALMNRRTDEQRVERQQIQQKLDDLRRAEEIQEAQMRATKAQAEADIERAKAEAEKAILEGLQAKVLQGGLDSSGGVEPEFVMPLAFKSDSVVSESIDRDIEAVDDDSEAADCAEGDVEYFEDPDSDCESACMVEHGPRLLVDDSTASLEEDEESVVFNDEDKWLRS